VGNVTAQIGHTKYKTIVSNGEYSIVVDEPETAGGGNTGLKPHDLLLGSLASCTAITLRMYIDRKMWLVDDISVNTEMLKNETGVTLKLSLTFKGDLSEEQKTRLLQIANACPIHKILTGSINIETEINNTAL
jgi:putative redox protein